MSKRPFDIHCKIGLHSFLQIHIKQLLHNKVETCAIFMTFFRVCFLCLILRPEVFLSYNMDIVYAYACIHDKTSINSEDNIQ